MKNSIHCCQEMALAINNPEVPICYVAKFREYGIRILDSGTSSLGIAFCPWCGAKLPSSLRDAWFNEMERLNIDPAIDPIPEIFQDESWYQIDGVRF